MATRTLATAPLQRQRSSFSLALDGVYTLWYRDVLRFARDRTRIIGSFAQPLLFLFIFGSGLSSSMGRMTTGTAGSGGLTYVQFIFPGIIAMSVLFTAIFGAISVIWDREFGFMKEVLVAPIPRWSVVVGKALGGSTTAMAQGVLMLIFAPLIGVSLSLVTVIEIVPLMFITAFAMSSMGLLIAARMRSMEGFQLIMNFLMMPIFFLSGALFPVTNLPDWLAVLTRIDPVAYGVDAIRTVVLGSGPAAAVIRQQFGVTVAGYRMTPLLDAAVVLAFGAIMITFAVRGFRVQD